MCPPSRTGRGRRLRTARFILIKRIKPSAFKIPILRANQIMVKMATGPPRPPAACLASSAVVRALSKRKIEEASLFICSMGLPDSVQGIAREPPRLTPMSTRSLLSLKAGVTVS